LITEAHRIPLAISLIGGNRNDVTQLIPLIEAIPPVRGRTCRTSEHPDA
jgi:transposase